MCLIALAINRHPEYKLVLLANRDEFFQRSTREAHWWDENPNIFGGKDLQEGGSWLAVSKDGKFAAITNYRDRKREIKNKISRGLILSEFMQKDVSVKDYIEKLSLTKHRYEGYNLLLGSFDKLYHYSNINDTLTPLLDGIHGLSNHLLDTPWPKVLTAKDIMTQITSGISPFPVEEAFTLFKDKKMAPDELLPDTGVGLSYERFLSPVFIDVPGYGTRATTLILVDKNNRVYFEEREHVIKSITKMHFEISTS